MQKEKEQVSPASRSRIKHVLLRGLLVGFSLLFVVLALELGLRVKQAALLRKGGALNELLAKSQNSALDQAQGEVSLRGLVRPSANPEIVYEAKPGLTGAFRGKPVSINRHGFRGDECEIEKPAGTFRIVGIGDSVMFGWGVGQEEYYVKVLERKLNELPPPHPRYEALNFALPGYNTWMEVETFEEKALAFQPDLVIIQFISNDFGVPHFMMIPPDPWALDTSYAWDFFAVRMGWKMARDEEGLIRDRHVQGCTAEEKNEVLRAYRHMVGPKAYVAAMTRLAELTRQRGIPVIVLIGHYSDEQGAIVRRVAAAHGFQVVDIGPITKRRLDELGVADNERARSRFLQVAPGDSHPNAIGHEIYADGLLAKIREMGILDETQAPAAAPGE